MLGSWAAAGLSRQHYHVASRTPERQGQQAGQNYHHQQQAQEVVSGPTCLIESEVQGSGAGEPHLLFRPLVVPVSLHRAGVEELHNVLWHASRIFDLLSGRRTSKRKVPAAKIHPKALEANR